MIGPRTDITARDYTTSGLVRIRVGPQLKEFTVHKLLLTANSPSFALNFSLTSPGGIRNVASNDFPSDDPDAFSVIVNWLYRAPLKTPEDDAEQFVYVTAYCLADRLEMVPLKNDLMDAIRRFKKTTVGSRLMKRLAELKLDSESPVQRYFVEQFVYDVLRYKDYYLLPTAGVPDGPLRLSAGFKSLFSEGGEIPVEVVELLLKRHHGLEDSSRPGDRDPCSYHDHSVPKACEFNKKPTPQRTRMPSNDHNAQQTMALPYRAPPMANQ